MIVQYTLLSTNSKVFENLNLQSRAHVLRTLNFLKIAIKYVSITCMFQTQGPQKLKEIIGLIHLRRFESNETFFSVPNIICLFSQTSKFPQTENVGSSLSIFPGGGGERGIFNLHCGETNGDRPLDKDKWAENPWGRRVAIPPPSTPNKFQSKRKKRCRKKTCTECVFLVFNFTVFPVLFTDNFFLA